MKLSVYGTTTEKCLGYGQYGDVCPVLYRYHLKLKFSVVWPQCERHPACRCNFAPNIYGMNGIIITMEKEELADLVQKAIEGALASLGFRNEPVEQEDLMTIEDVSLWLDIKKSALYQKTHYGEIPYMKKGKRVYFSRKELTVWLKEGKKLTLAERNELASERLVKLHLKRSKTGRE